MTSPLPKVIVPPLVDAATLEGLAVVANAAMNRGRRLTGVNSYERELGFDPVAFLEGRPEPAWLDLCCGEGLALAEAAARIDAHIEGVDLVPCANPRMTAASLATWEPSRAYDLVTCVHGLHYIADKLGLITRAASWLKPGGLFVAHLDLHNLKRADRHEIYFRSDLRKAGVVVSKGLARVERPLLELPYRFIGADPRAGPNCTMQPAVDSWYERRVHS